MVDLWLVLLIVAPVAITYFLKSNAALAYLTLCLGFVLLSLTTTDIQQLLDHANIVRVSTDTLGLVLLASPPVVTLLITRKSIRGQSNVLIQSLPAILLGALLALIAVPLFNASVRNNFTDAGLWGNLQKVQSWIIGSGALISILLVWSEHFHGLRRKRH